METLEQVKHALRIITQSNSDYQIRTEQYEGRNHLVVPVVMLVEGVHDGSRGPILHLAEEIGAVPEAWNGIPVTIDHPVDQQGEFVSANSPESLKQFKVGRVFGAHMDGDKLKAEAWLDEERLRQASAIALGAIRQMNQLEVSAGLFSQEEEDPGEFNGETYNVVARNPRPDHLALLPGGTGACSWEDGCGIRTNKEGGKNAMKRTIDSSGDVDKAKYLADLIANAESGYREVMSTIQSKLDAMDSDLRTHYLEEVYDDFFVYNVRSRENGTPPKLYKRGYSVNDSGTLEFAEEPNEVRKQVSYVNLQENDKLIRTKFSNNNNSKKEVKQMSDKNEKPCCEDVVDALIANEKTPYNDKDKTWLLTLEEGQIAKLVQAEKEEDPPEDDATPQLNAEQVKKIIKETFNTNEAFMELAPDEIRDQLNAGQALHKAQKEKMVKSIIANTDEGLWKEEALNAMDFEVLTKLHKSVSNNEGDVDYSLNAQEDGTAGGSGEKPLLPPGVKEKEKETVKE